MSLNRYEFEIKDTCIEFVINNVSLQGNVKIKLNLKVAEIAVLIFCGISGNAPGFCLALSEAYSQPCETANMKSFSKIVNDCYSQLFLQKAPS